MRWAMSSKNEEISAPDIFLDATQGFKGAHRRTNRTLTVSGLSNNECSESMMDRRAENW
jgi:hypothetical protein